uniref:acrosin-like n=1 Tax=Lonchura striata TaxID=40157 RepID=UPI0012930E79|nr:acrosin-like [Lonchura striata domestica]
MGSLSSLPAARGSCGLRVPPPVNSPMTYSYGNMAYDYGMTRIVGGTGAAEAEWPWIVSIQHPWVPGLGHWCGGSLITADWVLTAAHCFDKFDNISLLYVVIGATQLTRPGPGAQVRSVKQVVIHSDYRRSDYSYDIALMQLDRPVLCSSYIQLACLADPNLIVSALHNCWIAGWGVTTARTPIVWHKGYKVLPVPVTKTFKQRLELLHLTIYGGLYNSSVAS